MASRNPQSNPRRTNEIVYVDTAFASCGTVTAPDEHHKDVGSPPSGGTRTNKSQIFNDALDTDKIDIELTAGHKYFIRLPGEGKQLITVGSPYQITAEEEPRFPIHPEDDQINDYELTTEALLNRISESNRHNDLVVDNYLNHKWQDRRHWMKVLWSTGEEQW